MVAIPRPPRLASPPTLPGAPRVRRADRLTAASARAYPPKPARFRGPETEWACWWFLTAVKGFAPGRDFFFQAPLPALGVFVRGFTRVDFLIPFGPGLKGGMAVRGGRRGIVWDPITPFTHALPGLDRLKRAVLAKGGYRLVFIDGTALERDPRGVLELALRGIDVSTRRGS